MINSGGSILSPRAFCASDIWVRQGAINRAEKAAEAAGAPKWIIVISLVLN